jgi:hypothetical protein
MLKNVILIGLLVLAAVIRRLLDRELSQQDSEESQGPGIRW